jgi:hypothetical protein
VLTTLLSRSTTPNPMYTTEHGRLYRNGYAALILKGNLLQIYPYLILLQDDLYLQCITNKDLNAGMKG